MHARTTRLLAALGAGLALASPAARAELVGVEVESREALATRSGAFERLTGTLRFALDPGLPANRIVTDLEHAAADVDGRVTFSADFELVKPAEAADGNGILLFDVANRGRKLALSRFNFAGAEDLGDEFLQAQGFTVLWVGWQFDVPDGQGLLGVDAPAAGSAAAPIRGPVRSDFVVRSPAASAGLGDRGHRAYPTVALDDPRATLTVRDAPLGERTTIPRQRWRFARVENGREIPDPGAVTLDGGFEPHRIYEVVYYSENPAVAGVGLAAIRDAVSALKGDGVAALGIDADALSHAIGFGVSQSGRLMRTFLYDGFNRDEADARVFDGVMAHIAAGGRGSFNVRFAQPSRASWSFLYPNAIFPFADAAQTDPATGRSDGLLADLAPEHLPKVIYTNSSNEYWRGSAALTHVSIDGKRDLELPDGVRNYLLAGTQHGPTGLPARRTNAQQAGNPNDYTWFLRALVLHMADWITDGAAPPPSRHPLLADGTLTERARLRFPSVPGFAVPTDLRAPLRLDFGPAFASDGVATLEPPEVGAPFPVLLPQVDADGNETSGLVSPELAVPLATYTGFALYAPEFGPPTEMVSLQGSYVPFALTRAAREAAGDPRLSIEERYPSRSDYLARVRASAEGLVDERLVLDADVPLIVARAGRHWDLLQGDDDAD